MRAGFVMPADRSLVPTRAAGSCDVERAGLVASGTFRVVVNT